jgi:hypothetical protein
MLLAIAVGGAPALAGFEPIHLHPDYDHARYVTLPSNDQPGADLVYRFRAYTSVFDGPDDDDGDGIPDALGIPEFVTYEIKRFTGVLGKGPGRPSTWMTVRSLRRQGLAPTDATYRYSIAFRQSHPNWYVRGHLCMKQHAWRLGAAADWNTHTVLNAVPQRRDFNGGIWLDLENLTATWADGFGRVWVIAGPIFHNRSFTEATPKLGERQKKEMEIAIPDALFKIVVRETESGPSVLAFIYPQNVPSGSPYDHLRYAVSIDEIEEFTGRDFLASVPDNIENQIEADTAEALWPTDTED